MAASGPAHPESNIFLQFDVQQKGESVAGSAPAAGQFRCLLSPCHEEAFLFKCRNALESHRTRFHGLPSRGKMTLPTLSDIRKWMFLGKPRPYEVPVVRKTSWRDAFLHCSQPGELQSASLESNLFEQFDVRPKEGFTDPVYVCLLAPCFEKELCFRTHQVWQTHRRTKHREQNKLPSQWEIRDWVFKNKPRPYDVPVKPIPNSGPGPSLIDPGVFTELDIKVTHDRKERIFCLLHPCSHYATSFPNRKKWRAHRLAKHNHSDYKNGVFTLPSAELLGAWVEKGKPVPFRIPREFLPVSEEVNSGARAPTEMRGVLETQRPDSPRRAERNVFYEIDLSRDNDGNLRFFCLLPNCGNSGTGFARRQALEVHRNNAHKDLPQLERLPSQYVMNRWIWLGKPKPYTPPDLKRGLRIRTRDAVGSSSRAEPAHQTKRNRSARSVAASTEGPSQAASGEVPKISTFKKFLNEMNNPDSLNSDSDDETDSSEYANLMNSNSDDDCALDVVDDHNVDQTFEDPAHQNSAGMAEVGVEASDEFFARRNLVLQSVENEAGSEWPRGSETESVQEFVPPIELDMARYLLHEPEPAEMAGVVGDQGPQEPLIQRTSVQPVLNELSYHMYSSVEDYNESQGGNL